MPSYEGRREKAVLFKLSIFVAVFIATIALKNRLLPKPVDSRFTLFTKTHEELSGFMGFLRKQLYFSNAKEFLVLLFRVLLSSFLKDMLIAVCSPSIFDSPISERLIQKVENATLDKSWIPQTDHQRRLKFEREKLKEARQKYNTAVDSTDELSEPSDSALDENEHTFIYTFGHASVERSVQIGHGAAKMSVKCVHAVQLVVETLISKCINLVVFTIRSIVCTFSSILLLVLYAFQLVLRVIKLIYNFIEWILMYICSCVNDVALLAVEVIQESSLSNGEDIYTKLKESVERIRDQADPLDNESDSSFSSLENERLTINTPEPIKSAKWWKLW